MKQAGNKLSKRLPKGTVIPTGLFEVDTFFGGGLATGDYVGLIWQGGVFLHVDVEMMLQLACATSACASTACFVTPRKEDVQAFLEGVSTRDGFPPSLDEKSRMALTVRGQIPGVKTRWPETENMPCAFPLDVIQGDVVTLEEVEEAAKHHEVIIIDNLVRLEEPQETMSYCVLDSSAIEKAFNRIRSICKQTGALVMAGIYVGKAAEENEEWMVRCCGPNLPAAAFDKAITLDFPIIIEELTEIGAPYSGNVLISCADRGARRESDVFSMQFMLGKGIVSSSVSCEEAVSHFDSIYWADPFALSISHVKKHASIPCEDYDRDLKEWFARELGGRLIDGNRRFAFFSHWDNHVADDEAFLKGVLWYEKEVVLRQPPFSPPLETVLLLVKHDYPELIHVAGIKSMERIQENLWLVSPNYRLSPDETIEAFSRIDAVVDPVLKEVEGLSNIKKASILYNWLCSNVVCTADEIEGFTEIDSVFLLGRGTAQAIVKAWHYLCCRAWVATMPYVGVKHDRPYVWSIVGTYPEPEKGEDDNNCGMYGILHYDVAEDVLLSNIVGGPARMHYGIERCNLEKHGLSTPFGFMDEYALDLTRGRKDVQAARRRPEPKGGAHGTVE